MEIYNTSQYNQGVGKFKVLSSNAGVGAIITTKAGFFIMPQSVSLWGFIRAVNKQIENYEERNPTEIAKRAGVNIIDDSRFIEFLKTEQGIPKLELLVDVPHLSLDTWNRPKEDEHPLFKRHREINGSILNADHFTIPAIHFPRWFYSRDTFLLKPIDEWKDLWKSKRLEIQHFAPPRDASTKTPRTFKGREVYEPLVQVPILLICKNGHISDIPWYQLFCAGIDGKKREMSDNAGFNLFEYECSECEKGGKHELQWIENRNSSESWGTIKCKKCGKNHSLEGIMNIRPFCIGETPWDGVGKYSRGACNDPLRKGPSVMQMALVTSNSVYYANSFSSLFIPSSYNSKTSLSNNQQRVFDLLETKWYAKALITEPELTKSDFWNRINITEKADDAGIIIDDKDVSSINKRFLQVIDIPKDPYEAYRFFEYRVFSGNDHSLTDSNELEFTDILLPEELKPYFKKIQQVNTLALTMTQLGFSRVALPSPKRLEDGRVIREDGQPIFSEPVDKVFALPANQTFGEGLFFEFDIEQVQSWVSKHKTDFEGRYNQPVGDLGKALKEEMDRYGAPMFYLLHTFSHLIIKELEFSCGYPSASLQERLYYSDRMCGVLIYTTDGAEGSMGGLVWQGQPRLISRIINSALNRAEECSSDPLCWENEDQLNLAACFSCCLISETSCEKRNLGLDRRALVDENFGFFNVSETI